MKKLNVNEKIEEKKLIVIVKFMSKMIVIRNIKLLFAK